GPTASSSPLPLGFDAEPPHRYFFLNSLGGSLRCTGHGSPTPVVSWAHADANGSWGGHPATLTELPGLRQTSADGTTLMFPSFQPTDFRAHVHSASYRCVLSNAVGRMASRVVRVRAGEQDRCVTLEAFSSFGSAAISVGQ
ncbi:unnamed protein product, partial [Ixodes pacificus]